MDSSDIMLRFFTDAAVNLSGWDHDKSAGWASGLVRRHSEIDSICAHYSWGFYVSKLIYTHFVFQRYIADMLNEAEVLLSNYIDEKLNISIRQNIDIGTAVLEYDWIDVKRYMDSLILAVSNQKPPRVFLISEDC